MNQKKAEALAEKILSTQTTSSAEAIDAEKKRQDAQKLRQALEAERALLITEWERIQNQKATELPKDQNDPFVKRSHELREDAIRKRLAQIREALAALPAESGEGDSAGDSSGSSLGDELQHLSEDQAAAIKKILADAKGARALQLTTLAPKDVQTTSTTGKGQPGVKGHDK
ncbi:MAG TPA: hypothetical protein VJU61_07980 [Polyangiaceae bacterium]|nr:hypothetical protein [Polyangiaceae bacterium]